LKKGKALFFEKYGENYGKGTQTDRRQARADPEENFPRH